MKIMKKIFKIVSFHPGFIQGNLQLEFERTALDGFCDNCDTDCE